MDPISSFPPSLPLASLDSTLLSNPPYSSLLSRPFNHSSYNGEKTRYTTLWMEVYQLFLEQAAAGWNVEYSDPKQSKLHALPPTIAKAILDVEGFSFLSSESNTLAMFRSHHSLSDEPVPVERDANQAAWGQFRQVQNLESQRHPEVPGSAITESVASPQRAASSVRGTPARAPSTAENLLPVLGASGLAAEVRTALAEEAELFLNTQEWVVALASAALRLVNKMTQTRSAWQL